MKVEKGKGVRGNGAVSAPGFRKWGALRYGGWNFKGFNLFVFGLFCSWIFRFLIKLLKVAIFFSQCLCGFAGFFNFFLFFYGFFFFSVLLIMGVFNTPPFLPFFLLEPYRCSLWGFYFTFSFKRLIPLLG